MTRFVTIAKFAEESGYSEDALRAKMKDGTWLEGSLWRKAPDGRILIDREGFDKWVEKGQAFAQHRRRRLKSIGITVASVAGSG